MVYYTVVFNDRFLKEAGRTYILINKLFKVPDVYDA